MNTKAPSAAPSLNDLPQTVSASESAERNRKLWPVPHEAVDPPAAPDVEPPASPSQLPSEISLGDLKKRSA